MYPSTTIVIGGGGSSIFLARTGASIAAVVFVGCCFLVLGMALVWRSRSIAAASGGSNRLAELNNAPDPAERSSRWR